MRKCLRCEAQIPDSAHGLRKFCGKVCQIADGTRTQRSKLTNESEKGCNYCKAIIPPHAHGQRQFCDDNCKDKFNKEKIYKGREARTCKQCEKPIPVEAHHNVKHCSKTCRLQFFYHKKRDNRPEKIMLDAARSRAKKGGYPCTINEEDIIIPSHCCVLGLKLESQRDVQCRAAHNSPSLDKIVPSEGYVKGNIRVISQRANALKSDATFEEMEALYNDFRQLREDSCI